MAIVVCPECKKSISDKASRCVHCGYPLRRTPRPVEPEDALSQPEVDRYTIKKFRDQIHALGVWWIVIGPLALAGRLATAFATAKPAADPGLLIRQQAPAFLVLTGMGLCWFILGLLTCLKQIWAVYVGLVLSYLSLLGCVLGVAVELNAGGCGAGSIIGAVILLFVIIQAHRVIGWANQMRAARPCR